MFTYPDNLYISPKNTETNEVFPEPTDPTIAINFPSSTFKFMLLSMVRPSYPVHEK